MQTYESQEYRPTLQTQRLILRPFSLDDALDVQHLAGHREVTSRTGMIPYPYPDGLAEKWIGSHEDNFRNGSSIICAITLKTTGELIGCMSIEGISKVHQKGELAYWIAVDHWNQGYATEAARAVVDFALAHFKLNKITSRHKAFNMASGRVMQKLGMQQEGILRMEMFSDGRFHDVIVYGLINRSP